jgi:cobalt/nickel transport system permease protein
MHIPDGFLDVKTAASAAALAAGGVGVAVRRAQRVLSPRKVPLLGLSAAFIFAAQMLNFPVAAGTSGHLVGAVLAGVLLGPSAGIIAMTAVLVIQCLMFADGGITALGANIFNMAIVGVLAGSVVYRSVRQVFLGTRGMVLGAAFAGWCSTVLASIGCAGQLALSGCAAWRVVFPAMLHVHMLIGVGEGLITALVVAAIARSRPELVDETIRYESGPVLGYGLLVALGLAVFVAPFACAWPDGLEKVAGVLGFEHHAAEVSLVSSPMPDYVFPGIHSTALAGLVGTVAVFVLAWLLARALVPATPTPSPSRLETR